MIPRISESDLAALSRLSQSGTVNDLAEMAVIASRIADSLNALADHCREQARKLASEN